MTRSEEHPLVAPGQKIADRVSDRPAPLAYTCRQFAEATGLKYRQVTCMVRTGRIKSVPTTGRQRVIPHWAADEYLQVPPDPD